MFDKPPANNEESVDLCLFNFLPGELLLPIFQQLDLHCLKKIFVSLAISKKIQPRIWQALMIVMADQNVLVFFRFFRFPKGEIASTIAYEEQFFHCFNNKLLSFVGRHNATARPNEYYLKVCDGKKIWPSNLIELRNILPILKERFLSKHFVKRADLIDESSLRLTDIIFAEMCEVVDQFSGVADRLFGFMVSELNLSEDGKIAITHKGKLDSVSMLAAKQAFLDNNHFVSIIKKFTDKLVDIYFLLLCAMDRRGRDMLYLTLLYTYSPWKTKISGGIVLLTSIYISNNITRDTYTLCLKDREISRDRDVYPPPAPLRRDYNISIDFFKTVPEQCFDLYLRSAANILENFYNHPHISFENLATDYSQPPKVKSHASHVFEGILTHPNPEEFPGITENVLVKAMKLDVNLVPFILQDKWRSKLTHAESIWVALYQYACLLASVEKHDMYSSWGKDKWAPFDHFDNNWLYKKTIKDAFLAGREDLKINIAASDVVTYMIGYLQSKNRDPAIQGILQNLYLLCNFDNFNAHQLCLFFHYYFKIFTTAPYRNLLLKNESAMNAFISKVDYNFLCQAAKEDEEEIQLLISELVGFFKHTDLPDTLSQLTDDDVGRLIHTTLARYRENTSSIDDFFVYLKSTSEETVPDANPQGQGCQPSKVAGGIAAIIFGLLLAGFSMVVEGLAYYKGIILFSSLVLTHLVCILVLVLGCGLVALGGVLLYQAHQQDYEVKEVAEKSFSNSTSTNDNESGLFEGGPPTVSNDQKSAQYAREVSSLQASDIREDSVSDKLLSETTNDEVYALRSNVRLSKS